MNNIHQKINELDNRVRGKVDQTDFHLHENRNLGDIHELRRNVGELREAINDQNKTLELLLNHTDSILAKLKRTTNRREDLADGARDLMRKIETSGSSDPNAYILLELLRILGEAFQPDEFSNDSNGSDDLPSPDGVIPPVD